VLKERLGVLTHTVSGVPSTDFNNSYGTLLRRHSSSAATYFVQEPWSQWDRSFVDSLRRHENLTARFNSQQGPRTDLRPPTTLLALLPKPRVVTWQPAAAHIISLNCSITCHQTSSLRNDNKNIILFVLSFSSVWVINTSSHSSVAVCVHSKRTTGKNKGWKSPGYNQGWRSPGKTQCKEH